MADSPEEVAYELVQRGTWEIDPEGRVWKRGAGGSESVLATIRTGAGYLALNFKIQGKRLRCLAHRLIWRHFQGKIPAGMTINHKNGIKTDNRPDNLEVVSRADNLLHATHVLRAIKWAKGNEHYNSLLSESEVRTVWSELQRGVKVGVLAERMGVAPNVIGAIKNRRSWRHITEGLGPLP